ncbi:MAG: rhodanese-like domain-containing protein [Lachnospiraceae bacterium]|nr:rhodanese-like domain-containing protein [Lachnospiraceae bacterium]
MKLETISWHEFEIRSRRGKEMIVDLRDARCYQQDHFPGAVSIPYEELEERIGEIPFYRPVYFYCERGSSALMAARRLCEMGYMAIAVLGGYPKSCEIE